MPFIDIAGEPFHVRIDGSDKNPALLLSNSLSSDMAMWDEQVAVWVERFRVIRYDQRGHGRSVVSERPYSIAGLGADAIAVLDALGIAKAHWCGLSLGGMVGLWVLGHAPERIERAVLANTAAHMGPPALWNGRIALARRGGMEATVEPTITRWFPQDFRERAPEVMDRMREMVRRTPLAGYTLTCAAIRDMDQRHAIRAITTPTLVIIGAKDPATTPHAGELICSAIQGSQKLYLDAAHISCIEQPRAFSHAVAAFLAS